MKIDKSWLWVYRYVDGCGDRWINVMEHGLIIDGCGCEWKKGG